MLTLAAIKENPEEIVRKLAKKHFDAKELINKVLDLDKPRRNSQSELDARLATLKNLSGQIGKLMKEGKKEEADYATTIDLDIDAFIPESYIKNEYQKLDIYKRIATIETEEEMDDMTEELIDRFGDLPKKVQQLLHIAALKSLAHSAYITAIEQKGKDYKFILYEKANLDPAKIPALLKKYGNNMTFKAEAVPYFLYQKKGRSGKEKGENVLQMLREIIESIRELRLDQGS